MKQVLNRKTGFPAFTVLTLAVLALPALIGCPQAIQYDKSALAAAIVAAETAKEGVLVNTDHDNVALGSKWVTQAEMDALTAKLDAAISVNGKESVTEVQIAGAAGDLNTATAVFKEALKDGTKASAGPTADGVSKEDLARTMSAAATAKKDIKISDAAAKVPVGTQWVTEAEMNALVSALNAAIAVNDNAGATQEQVDNARTSLETATTTFNSAKKEGTSNFTPPAYTMISVTGATISTVPPNEDTNGPFTADRIPQTVANFKIGQTEVTYELWYAIRIWAEANGYTFLNPGVEGGGDGVAGTPGAAPTTNKLHPVTTIFTRDVIVWLNAYSEAMLKTPVYYADSAFQSVIRTSPSKDEMLDHADGSPERAFVNPGANGFRLPTEAEWEYAARGGNPSDASWAYKYAGGDTLNDVAWWGKNEEGANSGSVTHSVKGKAPNSLNLYDMSGNVLEKCWLDYLDTRFSPGRFPGRGGDWNHAANRCEVRHAGVNSVGSGADTGFRIASN
jgi:formylglycine-generating enzyme required for sulfatase activity